MEEFQWFYDNPKLSITIIISIILLVAIIIITTTRKNRQIDGYFLVLKPNSAKNEKVTLFPLEIPEKLELESMSEKNPDKFKDEDLWKESWKKLNPTRDKIFEWKPPNGSVHWKYVKGHVLFRVNL